MMSTTTAVLQTALVYYLISSLSSAQQKVVCQKQVDDTMVDCECMPFYNCNDNEDDNKSDYDPLNVYGATVIDIRIDVAECKEYIDKCCPIGRNQTKPKLPKQKVDDNRTCGKRNEEGVGFKIKGGMDNEANYGEFPWMVAVLRRDNKNRLLMQCGGTLVHPRVVVTGAHCVKGKKNFLIRAGEWDTQTEKEFFPIQEREVEDIIIHEEFYAGGLHNDIALLVLSTPVELTAVVDTICLPNQDENVDNRRCIVSGWGKDAWGKEGKYQVILKKVEMPIIPRQECEVKLRKTPLGPNFELHDSIICAGGELGEDSCKGDGGGPLACPSSSDNKTYVLAGIVAWGLDCGTENPGFYVNVPRFRTWIDDHIGALSLDIENDDKIMKK